MKKLITLSVATLMLSVASAKAIEITIIQPEDPEYNAYYPDDLSPSGDYLIGRYEHWTWTGLWNKSDFIMNWRDWLVTGYIYRNGVDIYYDNHWFNSVNDYGIACGRVDNEKQEINGLGIGVPSFVDGQPWAVGYVYSESGWPTYINNINTLCGVIPNWDNNVYYPAIWIDGIKVELPEPKALIGNATSDYQTTPKWVSNDNKKVIGECWLNLMRHVPIEWTYDGTEYKVSAIAENYIQSIVTGDPYDVESYETPYMSFEITDISESGNWLIGNVQEPNGRTLGARYNKATETLEVIEQEEFMYDYPLSVTNDGTCICYNNMIWEPGLDYLTNISTIYPQITEEYSLKAISADGKTILCGYNSNSVILTDCNLSGIDEIIIDTNKGEKGIYTLDGIKIEKITRPGLYIVDGEKRIVKSEQ